MLIVDPKPKVRQRHPFLSKQVKLSDLEQKAIDLEARYERMMYIWLTQYPDKKGPSKILRETHRELNNLWDQIREQSITKP